MGNISVTSRPTASDTTGPTPASLRPVRSEGHANLRVMIYSQDGLGLGHLRRTSAIAGELIEHIPGTNVLTCMDSPRGPFFQPVPGHDHLKLPGIVKHGPGQWRPQTMSLEFAQLRALRAKVLCAAAEEFQPDLLLVDHMPHGATGELLATLNFLRSRRPRTKIVLGLRDILDDATVVSRVWNGEGALTALAEFYDSMIIYGAREIFDAGNEYGFDAVMGESIYYSGYVGLEGSDKKPKDKGGRWLIFAMAGGGADGYPMMRAVVDSFKQVNKLRPCTMVLATGPFMPADLVKDLRKRATSESIKIKTTVKDPWRYLRSADTVVSMAGYNSSVEILQSGCQAILVPRPGPSAEQSMRARMFAEQGWVRTIHPADLTPQTMADEIAGCFSQAMQVRRRPSEAMLGGRRNSVGLLAALLGIEVAPRPRAQVAGS